MKKGLKASSLPIGNNPFKAGPMGPSAQTLNAMARALNLLAEQTNSLVEDAQKYQTLDVDTGEVGLLARLKISGTTAILQVKKLTLEKLNGKVKLKNSTGTADTDWVDLLSFNGTPLSPAFRVFGEETKSLQMRKIQFDIPSSTTTSPGTIGLENLNTSSDSDWVDVIALGECDEGET